MDAVLLIVTLVSLTMALTMAGFTWRLVRQERRRSAARVAALAEELAKPGDRPSATEAAPRPATRPAPVERQASPPLVRAAALPRESPRRVERAVEPAGDVLFRGVGGRREPDADDSPAGMFAATGRRGSRLRPIAAMLGAGLVLSGLVGLGLVAFDGGAGPDAGGAAGSVLPSAPLELLALHHERKGDTLVISGLVRNPATGATVARVDAVAFLFDRTGSFVASGRAPLDFTTLEPGDESPFAITVAAPRTVSRYRGSFRGADGAVAAHVDRRQ